jgi:hypothetical protein
MEMQNYASAFLDYENKRRLAEQRYRIAFQSWKEKIRLPLQKSNPLASSPVSDSCPQLMRELMHLCLSVIYAELGAFAVLLRQLGIESQRALGELDTHTKAALEEAYTDKWLSGWRYLSSLQFETPDLIAAYKKAYFGWDPDNAAENYRISNLWSILSDCTLEVMANTHRELWSPRAKFKEFEAFQGIDRITEMLMRMDQKFDSFIQKNIKKNKRTNGEPDTDERKIINAINEGLKGKGFCAWLDAEDPPVKPRKSWIDRDSLNPKWPGKYVKAYTTGPVKIRESWKKKIQDYKNDIKTKYPDLINKKNNRKNSPARPGE